MNCKPGDLAIAMAGTVTPEMAGIIVEVIRPAVLGERLGEKSFHLSTITGFAWVIRSTGRKIPVRTDSGRLFYVSERAYSDHLLRPVSGLPVNDEVTDDIKEPA
jgi:hypothetical protein